DFSILSSSASNSGFFQFAQLKPWGGKVDEEKNVAKNEKWVAVARLMFIASELSACGAVGGLRNATSIVPQSTTSNEMSNQHSFRFCCKYSFIGSGSICPEPLVEIMILALSGFFRPLPALLPHPFALGRVVSVVLLGIAEVRVGLLVNTGRRFGQAVQQRDQPVAIGAVIGRAAHAHILPRRIRLAEIEHPRPGMRIAVGDD